MKKLLYFFFILCYSLTSKAQEAEYKVYTVGFYNLENLFDTLHTEDKNDYEFLPNGKNKWTGKRYLEKQERMSKIIAKLGSDISKDVPTIVGVSEIETKGVVEDLVNQPALLKYNYGVAQIEGPDKRGVDVALIYRKDIFHVTKVSARDLRIKETYAGDNWEFKSRNQLIVEGQLGGENLAVIVNHWPSRRAESRYREEAGKLNRQIIDSLRTVHPNMNCITMGDLNDDPTNKSVYKSLGAIGDAKKLNEKNFLYNPYYKMYKNGLGSLAYRDRWNLFDQIIITKELKEDKDGLFFYKASICNYDELKNSSGKYKGYPYRTYAGGNYAGGYSDHFPVVIYLLKKVDTTK
ncbi:endonuclease/exonuclease/phosphatase family protein [Flammeovirga sp. SubArs3]|uniref:endonuclease/exonuclease/phosphatase family protein n=1 Tax=Flammeovirga sp. SubArs3 TaxID=2995316 RepID=UPI00248C8525|nr:endonuclease/exonuclease/phosphatase family protein [Flammeovirga sp. SubArs3]